MPKRQPSNADLLDEIQRLRDEVQRLAARPIVIQPYPVVQPYQWPRPYITWTAPAEWPTFTGGTNIATPMDNTTTIVWNANNSTPTA